jgi:hypothetical protein
VRWTAAEAACLTVKARLGAKKAGGRREKQLHGELEGLGRPRHALGGRLEGDAARGCSAFSVSGSREWVQGS